MSTEQSKRKYSLYKLSRGTIVTVSSDYIITSIKCEKCNKSLYHNFTAWFNSLDDVVLCEACFCGGEKSNDWLTVTTFQ